MHSLDVIIRKNIEATERELQDAIEQDDIALAHRIVDAVLGDALRKGTQPGIEETA